MTMTMTSGDPYEVLGLKRGASHQEIRRAYFQLVREHPPETDPEAFKAIRAAYEKVRSAEERAETDIYLLKAPPPWHPPARRRGPPVLDLSLPREAILAAARARTDLAHDDFRDDYQAVRL
jgi:curved DNA-binding protein CbpA